MHLAGNFKHTFVWLNTAPNIFGSIIEGLGLYKSGVKPVKYTDILPAARVPVYTMAILIGITAKDNHESTISLI